jgi:hypothetical protein
MKNEAFKVWPGLLWEKINILGGSVIFRAEVTCAMTPV